MGGEATAQGLDFSRGVHLRQIPSDRPLVGRVGDEPVLLSNIDGMFFAVSGVCTHYGAALSAGLTHENEIRCPLHHACFDLRSGRALHAPALDDLDRWEVQVEGDQAFVRTKLPASMSSDSLQTADANRVVIIGGGAAGLACANQLRKLGFGGAITIVSADQDAPCDRPNLSKDYLAGTALEEWMPLRSSDWYKDHSIDLRLGVQVERIDSQRRTVHCATGEPLSYDRLLLATGSEPNRLTGHGFHHPDVLTLRTLADARALVERTTRGRHAVIVGSSFIGLEAASALRKRGVEVSVVSTEHIPFETVLGKELGAFLQRLHEAHGVAFHLGAAAAAYDGRHLSTANGTRLQADYVLVGIGVRPRVRLAESAGLRVSDSVVVDEFLQTEISGIYAAGDVAAYPDPLTGELVRIEHWAVAERQGEVAAANMLGLNRRFDAVPFFWTEQHGLTLRYVGHAARWNELEVDGDLASGEFLIRYFDCGVHRASVTAGRDLDSLKEERAFEQAIERRLNSKSSRAPH